MTKRLYVQVYIGFLDRTWTLEEVNIEADVHLPEEDILPLAKLRLGSTLDVLDKDDEICFIGLYAYEEIE